MASSLTPSIAPLVWIDCEMTGLDPTHDVILEVSCLITTASLSLIDRAGLSIVISRPVLTMEAMSEWCRETHGRSGLTRRVLSETAVPADEAGRRLLEYIQRHVPVPRTALLAGNSVHADRAFLVKEMPEVIDWLHYRILDVSSIKEAARRWCDVQVLRNAPPKKGLHQARADIEESIEEARYWKQTLFLSTVGEQVDGIIATDEEGDERNM
jgi:oligoribonuclease